MSGNFVPNEYEDAEPLEPDIEGVAAGLDSSSEEEDEVIGRHTHIPCTLDKITISINGVKAKMLQNAKADIKETLSKARGALNLYGEETPNDLNRVINMFLHSSYLLKLLDSINRPFVGDSGINMEQLQECIRVLFALHFYKCSAEMFFVEGRTFYGEGRSLYGCPVNIDYNTYKRFVKGISYSAREETHGSTWNESQTYDSSITTAAKGIKSIILILFVFDSIINFVCICRALGFVFLIVLP
jgi:hypothetical protein